MEIKDISVIITTFKSENKIYTCIDSLPKTIKILVLENSNDEEFKRKLTSRYSNVECILIGENKGYSVANNIGLSKITSKYALLLNPDTIVRKNSLENFLNLANNNSDFWLIGPANNQTQKINNEKILSVKNIKGFAMFFNLEKFNNSFFDENFFLYFEEIDLCRNIIKRNGKIYICSNIVIDHDGASSVDSKNKLSLEKNRNWHWMWSTFYYHKKHNGFLIALLNILPKLFTSLAKIFFFSVTFNNEKKEIYKSRFNGIMNSIQGKKSWYRPTLD